METAILVNKSVKTSQIKKFPHTDGIFDYAQCVAYAKRNRLSQIPTEKDILLINYVLSDLETLFATPKEKILSKIRTPDEVQARIMFFYMLKTRTNLIDSHISCFLLREHAFARFAKNEHNCRLKTDFRNYTTILRELILLTNEKFDRGPRRFISSDEFMNNHLDELEQEMEPFRRFAKELGHLNVDHKIREFFIQISKKRTNSIEILEYRI